MYMINVSPNKPLTFAVFFTFCLNSQIDDSQLFIPWGVLRAYICKLKNQSINQNDFFLVCIDLKTVTELNSKLKHM